MWLAWCCTGPEYLKKRILQEVAEGSENTDIALHEPLLAEDEPLPTPPESPLMNELVSLMPGSSPGRTPSPSPFIIGKEDPKLLGPGGWNEDKPSRGGSKGGSKPNSKPNSRPTTPSTSSAAASQAPEGAGGVPSRNPSRQSSKVEQGSDLEIKPLQKFESEVKAPDVPPAAAAAAPVAPPRTSLIVPDEEEAPRPSSKAPAKAATPEHKPPRVKADRAPETPVPENKAESREASRPPSRAETTRLLPKRQPSPAPSPKPAPKLEPKAVPKQAEAKAIVAKPIVKAEPKVEARQRAVVSSPSSELAEYLEQEVGSDNTDWGAFQDVSKVMQTGDISV